MTKETAFDPLAATPALGAVSRQARQLAHDLAAMKMENLDITPHDPKVSLAITRFARCLLKERRQREAAFGAQLFADPAWDMMLELFIAKAEAKKISISGLCISAAVPHTTALRWVKSLTQAGLFIRTEDVTDARRAWVELAPDPFDVMHRLLERWQLARGR